MEKGTRSKSTLKGFRWTIEYASGEFDINPRTLSKRLKSADTQAGEDGKYNTAQVCAAVFGDMAGEKLRNEKLKADLLELELAREQGKVLDTELTRERWTDVAMAITQRIKASPLTDKTKGEILRDIREMNFECTPTKSRKDNGKS